MPAQRKPTHRVAALNPAERNKRSGWLIALTIGASSPAKGTYGIGYYFFAEVWPALLRAGSG